MSAELWEQLLTPQVLKRGWHIARAEERLDFAEDLYSTDVLAIEHEDLVQEVMKRLSSGTYLPSPLLHVEVPKGVLGIRPGTVMAMRDRMILAAIVLLLAPRLDDELPKSVYSWRLKKPLPKKGPIFKETELVDLPYLKAATISQRLNPFDSWYRTWPDFDARSRKTFGPDRYRYLATSDIAAYFENIQLPILRDQLLGHFPDEPELINLLFSFLELWAHRTTQGRPYLRGIPQGSSVSSFLGNIFLLPLDQRFAAISQAEDIRYYRYMDDVRVFTHDLDTARKCVFEMIRVLRSLHLNVQTAKTKILDERNGEITAALIDPRVEELNTILDDLQEEFGEEEIPPARRKADIRRANRQAKRKVLGSQAILGARKPLEGLELRVFKRWLSCHLRLDSHEAIRRLLREIERNPDYRLTRKLVSCARRFPRNSSIETSLLRFMGSDKCIFPHQRAECLRAIRYLSRVGPETVRYARKLLYSASAAPYERVQAAYLLGRTELTPQSIGKCERIFRDEPDPFVQAAVASLLVQRRKRHSEIVRALVFHSNEQVRLLGRYFRCLKNDTQVARNKLEHALRPEVPWLVCDNMPAIHLMENSTRQEIRALLAGALEQPARAHPHTGIREILGNVERRVRASL